MTALFPLSSTPGWTSIQDWNGRQNKWLEWKYKCALFTIIGGACCMRTIPTFSFYLLIITYMAHFHHRKHVFKRNSIHLRNLYQYAPSNVSNAYTAIRQSFSQSLYIQIMVLILLFHFLHCIQSIHSSCIKSLSWIKELLPILHLFSIFLSLLDYLISRKKCEVFLVAWEWIWE